MAKKKAAKKSKPAKGTKSLTVAVETDALTASAATVDEPGPGAWLLGEGTGSQINVVTSNWNSGDRAFAKIHGVDETPSPPTDPDHDLEGFKELLPPTPGSDVREAMVDIPSTVPCAYVRPAANNIAVTIAYIENAHLPPALLLRRVKFKYICRKLSVLVPAYACPWFAFRQDDEGPRGEDIPTHRPIRVNFPQNAATVALTASGRWRHQAIDANGDAGGSGPEGLGAAQPLAEPRYQTESNNDTSHPPIEPVPDGSAPAVNTLVGVLDLKHPEATPTTILVLGGAASISSPEDSFAIFLGMWDGTQWNKAADPFSISNSGEVTVTFEWAP